MKTEPGIVPRPRAPRRIPEEFKRSLLAAFEVLQGHPKASLVQWGIENPTLFYNMVRDISMATLKGEPQNPQLGNIIQIVTGVPTTPTKTIEAQYTQVDDGNDLV